MCLSHLIYTVRPCLIHTCHAAPMPCSDHAVFSRPQHNTAVEKRPCCAVAWSGHGMASVNQTWPHCVNQMGMTHSKPLGERHGRGVGMACCVWIGLKNEIHCRVQRQVSWRNESQVSTPFRKVLIPFTTDLEAFNFLRSRASVSSTDVTLETVRRVQMST